MMCLYLMQVINVQSEGGRAYGGVFSGTDAADREGFVISPKANTDDEIDFRGVWAYRAP